MYNGLMAGYSGRTLIDKLGIKAGQLVYFRDAPDNYAKLLGSLPKGVFLAKKLNRPMDFMQCFYTEQAKLKKDTIHFKQYLEQNGILWICWPKKTSKVETDVTEDTLRKVLLPLNLVDIKVAAIDETWSGLKFVWRKS
ncbi:MAG: hypothetical protein JWO47_751 [Candidatus Saccharibacteria bacterium]|nr:hypothetical protein [Candidatus Saccharibacteria bacterium]